MITLGQVKNTLVNTKSPFTIFKQFYTAGGIKGVLFGLGPATLTVVLFVYGFPKAAAYVFMLGVPIGIFLLARSMPDDPNKKP